MNYSNSYFPSQAVSDLEKMSMEYGEKIAEAIKHEWFSETRSKFRNNLTNFHKLILLSRC